MTCGQCEVSKCLVYRHILKSVVKKLEEKNQKFSFSKLDLSLSVHMESAVLLPPDGPLWDRWPFKPHTFASPFNGVFTLSYSGTETETGTGTGIMQNLSHCTGTRTGTGKNGLYGFDKSLSHCTGTGTGTEIWKMGIAPICVFPGPCPCPSPGAMWKALIKTIQAILPGPGPGLGPGLGSGPGVRQCEYTIILLIQ